MSDWFATTTMSGTLLLAAPIAVLAGLISFLSPCVLPLVPGYLSYVTGLVGLDAPAPRRRVLIGASGFVAGFGAVFVSFGSLFGAAGYWLLQWQRPLSIVLGAVIIVVGFVFIGHLRWAQRDWRIHAAPQVGVLTGPVLGLTFALGWTPCLGPTLTAVLALSSTEATAGRGALLAAAYSLGLGLPFLAAAAFSHRLVDLSSWTRRRRRLINLSGGAMLIALGLALVTGVWDDAMYTVRGWTTAFSTIL